MIKDRRFVVNIDESTYVRFWRMTCGKTLRRSSAIWGAILISALVLGLILKEEGDVLIAGAIGGGAALIVVQLVGWFRIPARARKAYHTATHLSIEQIYEMDENEIAVQTKLSSARIPWGHFWKWEESPALLALYPQMQIAYLLPKDQVTEGDLGFIRESLTKHGLKIEGKPRK